MFRILRRFGFVSTVAALPLAAALATGLAAHAQKHSARLEV